ncbi:MAG: DUF2948 family protein [Gemmobacter sp.]|nr:DUF2948 family protein [Gemmobacter sp.]
MTDARFEDGAERALRLRAEAIEDIAVLSALVQDAVLPASEMRYDSGRRRFALLINRFRWEDRSAAERQNRPYERVQSLLVVNDVTAAATHGFDRRDADTVLSILAMSFEPGEDGTGALVLTLAGDGALRLKVECLDVTLQDATRPYIAPSRHAPDHPQD